MVGRRNWAVLVTCNALERSDAVYHEYRQAGVTMCGKRFNLTAIYAHERWNWVLRANAEKFARPCKRCVDREADLSEIMERLETLPPEPGDAEALITEIERQASEIERLRKALRTVVAQSLLDVRRACFAPEIGTRMTERWRSDMADACRRLEDHARVALNEKGEGK